MIYQMHENLKGRDNQLKSPPPPKKNITIYFAYLHVSNFYSEKTEIYISCLFWKSKGWSCNKIINSNCNRMLWLSKITLQFFVCRGMTNSLSSWLALSCLGFFFISVYNVWIKRIKNIILKD